MTNVRRQLIIAMTVSLLIGGAGPPVAAQGDDSFEIAYGDTVADGVPAAGAGNIEVGDAIDAYRFVGEAGDLAIFDALVGGAGTFRWRLEAEGGSVLFDAIYTDRRHELPETGTYVLTVRGATPTTTGTYSFSLLLTPPAQDFTIAFGDTVSDGVPEAGAGNLEVPGAIDRYEFAATADQAVIFDVLSGNAGEVRWSLHAPDGSEVFDSLYFDQERTLPQGGTYTLTLSGLNVASSGVYSFRLLLAPTPQEFTIGFGDTVSDGVPGPGAGNLEGPGAIDRYRFDGTAGQVALLDALTGSTNVVRWRLEAPDGTVIFDTFYVDQQATLPQTGTYLLEVGGLTLTSFGSYSFQLRHPPPNTPPVAEDDAAETDHDTAVMIDVLANDTDPDGDALAIDVVSQPASGIAAIAGDQVTYTPNSGFAGIDSFAYTITDGQGGTANATVTVHESPNTPPTIDAIPDQQVTVRDEVTLDVEADDPDGDPLSFAAIGLPPDLTIDPASGGISGTIGAGADTASPYTVEVTVTDPDGVTASATFQWTVYPRPVDTATVRIDIVAPCIFNDGFGVIPVVIYGNERVDTSNIDLATVELEGMPVQRIFRRHVGIVHDFDGDGVDDVLVLIDERAGSLREGATTATLTGQLMDGTPIEGSDDICLLPRA